MAPDAKEVTSRIFDLYRKYGERDYIGEPVSQTEHMVQAAMLAEKEGFGEDAILGAFFHDIGHLIGFDKGLSQMGDVGTDKHDLVGKQYLKDLGFPDAVTNLVGGHVEAKRYLVYKQTDYHDKLSEASKLTLVYQGGPMTEEEAAEFESQDGFEAIIKMRSWDEQAKIKGLPIESIEKYESMCCRCLEKTFVTQ